MARVRLTRAAVVDALVLGGGGGAAASIPSPGGAISACYKKSGRAVRVVDTAAGQTCAADESALSLRPRPALDVVPDARRSTCPRAGTTSRQGDRLHLRFAGLEVFAAVNCRLYQDRGNGQQMIALDQSQVEVSSRPENEQERPPGLVLRPSP